VPVSVIIPAFHATDSIAATVAAARRIAGVNEVIVVDDGSRDGTEKAARDAGADRVVSLPRNQGKGRALQAGVAEASGETLLFLDADLGGSAARAGTLLDTIAGRQAMSIAVLPRHERAGGFGLARGLAAAVIRLFTGLRVSAPLSGQRALPAAVVRRIGIAPRWAVEVALTVEAAHLGLPIVEQEVDLEHCHTGRDVAGFRHRFRQFADVLRYALLVGYGLGWPALTRRQVATRLIVWLAGFTALIGLEVRSPLGGVMPVAVQQLWGRGISDETLLLWNARVFGSGLVLGLLCLAAVLLWLPSLWLGTVALGARKTNYLGRSLPGAAGLLLPLIALPAACLGQSFLPLYAPMGVVVGGLAAVGLLDDLFGHLGKARGLRGHLRSLLRGRVTTGAIKAIGGLSAGLIAAYLLDRHQHWALLLAILDGLVIALTANLLNLLDLRPGRALKGFLFLISPVLVAILTRPDLWSYVLPLLGPALAAALVLAPADLSGRVMLGDVGANTLGGLAGLALVVFLPPVGRVVALSALIAIHLYCERASLTDLIARYRLLRFLDQLGTRHLPPLEAGEEAR